MVEILDEAAKGRWSKQKAAQEALALEEATNAADILRTMYEIYRAYIFDGTSAANHSTPLRLATHRLAFLTTGEVLFGLADYLHFLEECQKIAEGK